MKALCYEGPRAIRYSDFPEPTIRDDRDIIVRVEQAGICGSDLHIYNGQGFSPDTGFCVGHEAVVVVLRVGEPGERKLFQIAEAKGRIGSLSGLRQCGQEKRGKKRDNGEDDEEFDEGESVPRVGGRITNDE